MNGTLYEKKMRLFKGRKKKRKVYQKELEFARSTLKKAYEIYCESTVFVSEKAAFDVVTNVDLDIERYFERELKKAFPDHRLHGEEFSADASLTDRTWILDPIDGTFNFATGTVHFGLQTAFWDKGELRLSVIYLPRLGELYEATLGGGAFCNGAPIHVSCRSPKEAIFSFGDYPHARERDAADEHRLVERAYRTVSRMRMFGAASVDFTLLAAGKTEGVVLYTRNKWDIAPGLLLCREAGAVTYSVDGGPYDFSSRGIFACNTNELYDALMKEDNL